MKTPDLYKYGTIIMYIMIVYEILFFVIFIMLFNEPETRTVMHSILYQISVLIVTTVVGLVKYVNKKTLGWILCCGIFLFMFVFTIIGCLIFRQFEINFEIDTKYLLVLITIQCVFYALALLLFLTYQVRSVFFDSVTLLRNIIPAIIVAAIIVGVIVLIPLLGKFFKTNYIAIFVFNMVFILRYLINHI